MTDQGNTASQGDATDRVVHADLRPTRASGAVAVLLGVVAVLSLDAATLGPAIAVEAVGLVALAGGLTLVHRGHRLVGLSVVGVSVVLAVAAVAILVALTETPIVAVQYVPGIVGVFVLALGVVPLRSDGSRRLVKAGTGLVLLTLCLTGLVQKPSLETLLVAGVATVLAWDTGEYAVGLGRQLGRRAQTYHAEAVHGLGSVAVGIGAVVAGRTVNGLGSPGLPLGVFVLLVIGLVLLAGALHD